jgi:hypothetical protein
MDFHDVRQESGCMRKLLETTEPIISGRYNYAVPLTIGGHHDQSLLWLYNHFIELHFKLKDDYTTFNFVDSEFPSHDGEPYVPFLKHTTVLKKSIQEPIVDYLIRQIDDGVYVYGSFNKFFVPHTFYYQRYSFIHPLMVYGYDREEKQFYIKNFNESFVYSDSVVSFEQLEDAYYCVDEARLEPRYQIFRQLEFRPEERSMLQLEQIRESLKRFLNPPASEGSVSGVDTYAIIAEHLQSLKNEQLSEPVKRMEIFNTRKHFHVLYEHNKIMKLRIAYLIGQGHMPEKDFLVRIDKLSKNTELTRNYLLKYTINRAAPMLSQAMKLFESYIDEQQKLLEEICSA